MLTSPLAAESAGRKWLRNALQLALIALLLSGIGGFLATAMLGTQEPSDFSRSLRSLELPLGDLKAIAVSREGALYTYAAAYSRLQRYDLQPAGPARFVAGWQVPPFKGRPELRIDALNALHLRARGKHWRLEPGFGLIEDPIPFDAVEHHGAAEANRYEIRQPILLAKVVRQPGEQVLIETRWQVYGLMAGPLIAWLSALAAALLLSLLHRLLPQPGTAQPGPARE